MLLGEGDRSPSFSPCAPYHRPAAMLLSGGEEVEGEKGQSDKQSYYTLLHVMHASRLLHTAVV